MAAPSAVFESIRYGSNSVVGGHKGCREFVPLGNTNEAFVPLGNTNEAFVYKHAQMEKNSFTMLLSSSEINFYKTLDQSCL